VTVARTHSARRDSRAWCAWRNAGSGAGRTGLRRCRGTAACLKNEARGRDCLADMQGGLGPMAVGPAMEGSAGLRQTEAVSMEMTARWCVSGIRSTRCDSDWIFAHVGEALERETTCGSDGTDSQR